MSYQISFFWHSFTNCNEKTELVFSHSSFPCTTQFSQSICFALSTPQISLPKWVICFHFLPLLQSSWVCPSYYGFTSFSIPVSMALDIGLYTGRAVCLTNTGNDSGHFSYSEHNQVETETKRKKMWQMSCDISRMTFEHFYDSRS